MRFVTAERVSLHSQDYELLETLLDRQSGGLSFLPLVFGNFLSFFRLLYAQLL